MDELRVVARYVAECAEGVLSVFEDAPPDDSRPRAAVGAGWKFVNGARRTTLQRVTSLDAHRAAKEAATEAARLAANCVGDAASAALSAPDSDAHQVGHIPRAPASAARIAELNAGDDPDPSTFSTYADHVGPIVERHGGRYITIGTVADVLEGEPGPTSILLIRFEDLAAARRWYESDDYQAIMPVPQRTHDGRLVRRLIAGYEVPLSATCSHPASAARRAFLEVVSLL